MIQCEVVHAVCFSARLCLWYASARGCVFGMLQCEVVPTVCFIYSYVRRNRNACLTSTSVELKVVFLFFRYNSGLSLRLLSKYKDITPTLLWVSLLVIACVCFSKLLIIERVSSQLKSGVESTRTTNRRIFNTSPHQRRNNSPSCRCKHVHCLDPPPWSWGAS